MSSSILFTLSALFTLALSAVTPTAPAPNATFIAGHECTIQWNLDTTGTWTAMTIQLMAGTNLNMSVLETVAILDGTKLNNFTWPCPQIKPPAPIVFYQFSINNDPTTDMWTGRFLIADPDGTAVPAPNATQDGQNIPWGQATIVQNFSTEVSGTAPATTMPSVVGNATSSAPITSSTSGASSSSSSGSSSGSKGTTVVSSSSHSSSTSTAIPTGANNGDSTNKSNGAERLVAGGVIGFVAALLALV